MCCYERRHLSQNLLVLLRKLSAGEFVPVEISPDGVCVHPVRLLTTPWGTLFLIVFACRRGIQVCREFSAVLSAFMRHDKKWVAVRGSFRRGSVSTKERRTGGESTSFSGIVKKSPSRFLFIFFRPESRSKKKIRKTASEIFLLFFSFFLQKKEPFRYDMRRFPVLSLFVQKTGRNLFISWKKKSPALTKNEKRGT